MYTYTHTTHYTPNTHTHPQHTQHTTTGRGRTGTVISALMLKLQMFDDARSALKFFADARSSKGYGVITPSQL